MSNNIIKETIEVDFDWVDSNTLVLKPDGSTYPAGTTLKLISQVLFLEPLTNDQLIDLKKVVSESVEHELRKRQQSEKIR